MRVLALLPLIALSCTYLQDRLGLREEGPALVDPAERPERIATLEASIEADHETLEALVAGEGNIGNRPLHENEALQGIADRLGRNEEELEALLRAEKSNR